MGKFTGNHKLRKLTQKETESLKKKIKTNNDLKNYPQRKPRGQMASTVHSTKYLNKNEY